ncbi:hypothetical protein HG536_0E05620 [Torulaspora globosa]|uniref:Cell division control protein 25 n=1 Tax=Torulaspora globosa TaxID=48254 RepID=A0A7G3ZJG5_9SACH|nr:uncharacterized protein HG536_0E05620 [Torulaspora globosa]QLL33651.1 hypothetical protein HG536_0E05620 [Torulaspora globosa]
MISGAESKCGDSAYSETTYPLCNVSPIAIVTAIYDYSGRKKNHLSFQQGDTIYVLEKHESGWWDGLVIEANGKVNRGWFPQNYCRAAHAVSYNHLASKMKRRASQMKPSYSTQTSRRGSLQHQPAFAQLSPQQRKSSVSASSPPRNSFSAQLHNQGHMAAPQHRRSNSHSHSPTESSFGSISASPMGAGSQTLSNLGGNPTNLGDLSHQQRKSLSEAKSLSSSGPPSSSGSRMGSRSMSATRTAKSKHLQQHGLHQQINEHTGEKLTILSSEEIEMIFNSMHTEVPPVWSPVPTANSEKVLYYNKHFDIYCSQMPLVSSAFLETSSSLTLNDQQVDLSPRDLQNASKHKDKTFKLMSYSNRSTNTPSKRSSLSSASCNYPSPSTHTERRNSSTSTTHSNFYRAVSESSSVQQPHSRGVPQKHHSAPVVGVSSTSASKRKHPPPSLQPCQHKHTKTQAILAKPDLFYHHTMDIKLWPELRDSTLYYAKRAHEMLIKNNQLEFEALFQLSSTYCTYTQIACRLSYPHIKESCRVKEVKRLLKRIIASLVKIGINSSIYFTSSHRSLHIWNTTPRASEVSETSIENNDDSDFGAITRSGTVGAATLTSEDIAKSQNLEHSGSMAQNERSFSSDYGFVRNKSATTTRTSVPSEKHNIDGFAPDSMMTSLYENLDNEFTQFIKTIQLLYHVLQTSVTAGDYIPQLFPRFFRGSFNGGSWNNPFSQFDPVNDGINDTEDSSNNGSSIGGLPPKIAEAIAAASGCHAASYIDLHSQVVSPHDAFHSNQKAILCQGFNRPSHHRTFSRSRASRKIQYPLSENTVNMMKKRYFSICEKISSFELNEESYQDPELTKSKKRQLEVTSQTYEEVSSCILLEVLENLDLGIFVNLRTLIASNKHLDAESEEFLRHALSSISTLLTEFFDTKQAFHDTVIKLIMCAQQLTLYDPYVFCSMRPNTPVGYNEPGMSPSQSHFNKIDKAVSELYKLLVAQDVEFNNMQYLRTFDEFSDVCLKYTEIASLSCTITEQLVEERENLLNYAARTMRNDLTTKLLKGESEKWFGDYDVFEPEDNEPFHSSDDEYHSDYNTKSENLDKDTPWFLGSEFEKTLIYDQRGRVKGGTKKALIEHLTSHEIIDAWFNVTMLLTFRSMFTTREFLYSLVHRYNLYPPEGLSYDEYNLWVEKKLNPIKCRVVSILKSFFSQYWTPAYFEPGISATLNFAHIAVSENIPGAQELFQDIKDNLASHGKGAPSQTDIGTFGDPVASDDSSDSHRPVLSARSSSSSFLKLRRYKLLDIDPKTYAAQLTIMEHALYLRITVFECLDRAWGMKYCDMGGSSNIANFIASANNLTNYVSHAIVLQTEVKIRALLIQYFVSVAEHCRELNNFSSMTAIVSALCSSPIYRLKKTWPLVSRECTNVLKELNKLMDSAKNFIHYRELLRSVKDVACVPFFGVYLSDLTFTFGGNPDYLHNSNEIINFSKRGRIVDIVEEIMSFKKIHYKLKRYDDIQTIIEGSLENVPHIEKQYELSLLIEPRSDAQNRPTANDPLKGFKSSAAPDDRNSRLLKFGKKQSSRLFAKPND